MIAIIPIYTYFIYYFLLSPLIKLLAINVPLILFGIPCEESVVRNITKWTIRLDFFHIIGLVAMVFYTEPYTLFCKLFGVVEMHITYSWFLVATLSFSIFLLSLVNYFSCSYLHRDQYFHKFFTLFYLFKLAVILLNFSNTTRFLFIGWELLGLSSVLLIGFYEHRIEPIKNAIRILFIYKVSDIFLFTAFLLAMLSHVETFSQLEHIHGSSQVIIYSFILLACLIKSGVLPWQWLPKAMEGPTPSSSIFYGALATHIPLLILTQLWPHHLTGKHPVAIVGITACIISAIIANSLAKQSTDAKNSITYAITTQLALIYCEILLGFSGLALFHGISHGLFRTFELLKTPSIIHTIHTIELNRNPKKLEQASSEHSSVRMGIYALALKRYGILNRLYNAIDYFLGLNVQKRSCKNLVRFSTISLALWGIISVLSLNIRHESLYIWDELVIFGALLLTFSAYNNLKKSIWFLSLISASMGLLFLSLIGHIVDKIGSFEWTALIIVAAILLFDFKTRPAQHLAPNFYSKRKSLLILLLGFCVVGIPGLAGHFLWENVTHVVAFISPHLVLTSFFVMSLNTILFIIFYYQYLIRSNQTEERL